MGMRATPPVRVTAENVEPLTAIRWAIGTNVNPLDKQAALEALAALADDLAAANARADAADLMCAKAGSIAADAVADLEATKRERDEARRQLKSCHDGYEWDSLVERVDYLEDQLRSAERRAEAAESALAVAQDALRSEKRLRVEMSELLT